MKTMSAINLKTLVVLTLCPFVLSCQGAKSISTPELPEPVFFGLVTPVVQPVDIRFGPLGRSALSIDEFSWKNQRSAAALQSFTLESIVSSYDIGGRIQTQYESRRGGPSNSPKELPQIIFQSVMDFDGNILQADLGGSGLSKVAPADLEYVRQNLIASMQGMYIKAPLASLKQGDAVDLIDISNFREVFKALGVGDLLGQLRPARLRLDGHTIIEGRKAYLFSIKQKDFLNIRSGTSSFQMDLDGYTAADANTGLIIETKMLLKFTINIDNKTESFFILGKRNMRF